MPAQVSTAQSPMIQQAPSGQNLSPNLVSKEHAEEQAMQDFYHSDTGIPPPQMVVYVSDSNENTERPAVEGAVIYPTQSYPHSAFRNYP